MSDSARDRIYVELVRGLFATIMPPLVMSSVFAVAVALIVARTDDRSILLAGLGGLAASAIRLGTVVALKSEALSNALTRARAHRAERLFAVTYVLFALFLGLFGGLAFRLPDAAIHMLTGCLLVGYCAGVAAVVGLRPALAIPSMVIAIGPAIVVAALRLEPMYAGMSLITSVLLAAGARNTLDRYRHTTAEIGKRITFESLARRDSLTGLPNRLGLGEAFEAEFRPSPARRAVALHYIDLDGFKPVNDAFGHPVGDALLCAVSARLQAVLHDGDIAARLGGDEFIVLQQVRHHSDESELTAQRLAHALRQPFQLGARDIEISACVGSVVSGDRGADLEQLLERADQAMYVAKRRGSGNVERVAA